jgi:hypothetical protein
LRQPRRSQLKCGSPPKPNRRLNGRHGWVMVGLLRPALPRRKHNKIWHAIWPIATSTNGLLARVIRRDIYVGESAAEAAATGGRVVAAGYRGFAPEATIVGDAATVAAAFADLGQMGYTHILVRNLVPTQAEALASLTRLAQVKEMVNGS